MVLLIYEAADPIQLAYAACQRRHGPHMSYLLPHMVDAPPDDPERSHSIIHNIFLLITKS
jgi:hypothetical protein